MLCNVHFKMYTIHLFFASFGIVIPLPPVEYVFRSKPYNNLNQLKLGDKKKQ